MAAVAFAVASRLIVIDNTISGNGVVVVVIIVVAIYEGHHLHGRDKFLVL